ncbi:unnamed protein product [Leptidea sinapis]|uniref:ABC-type xenobiotic transporter n=1 Tax=Leptidea sinapis TaxID=189913 RepID=A0A5E4R402_9NEOP|nr:unnamed protein product [Leptidea sinapis]
MSPYLNISLNWEDICGPSGFHPWNETSKDFGICFQELLLQTPMYSMLAVLSAYFIGYRRDWVIREKTQERAIALRSFIVLVLVLTPIVQIYAYLTTPNLKLFPVDYFIAGTSCITWLVHFGYVLALKHRLGQSSRGPLLPLLLWGAVALLNIIELRSTIVIGAPPAFSIATLCCHALYFLTLLPGSDSRPTFYSPCLVGSQHSHSEYTPLLPHVDEGILGTAMQGANYLSKLTFSWVNPLLDKGLDNKLNDIEELHDIPARYRCSYVGARLDRALIGNIDNYQQFREVPHEPFIGSGGYGATGESVPQVSTPVTPTSRVIFRPVRRQNVSLLRALHSCFALQFYGIGILKLISDMAGFAGPILLNKLVKFVEDDSIDQHFGYVYSSSLLAAALVSAFCNVHFNWLMSIIGIKMRGAIVSTILRKTLSVTESVLTTTFSIGEITNFMSTDTDRIVNSCPSFHALWSIPLQLVITLLLLYDQVGISFLAGVAFSIILIPINKVIANKIGELSTEMMKHKDTRVNLICDLIKGIRTVFTTVALINMLISPLNAFPWVLNGLTEAWVSIKRIQKLLNLHDMDPERYYGKLNKNCDEDKILIFKNATFTWTKAVAKKSHAKVKKNKGKSKKKMSKRIQRRDSASSSEVNTEEPFMLRDLSLEVGQDELVGVCGPVGSGKTSLLLAIMGEMVKQSGEIQIPENLSSFGYASQQPWLVRGTVRDNILFGKPYDETKFRAVVDACALTDELKVLGYNAYVGEGGCTLSGGQRARIALARAVYQDKKVYLLDDILSGLDSGVAQHIMQRCILGLLRHTARILVTHSPRHLARAHRVVLLQEGVIHAIGPPESVLNEIDEFLQSETESIGEEPMETVEAHKSETEDDNVSRDSVNNDEAMSIGAVGWWVIGMYLRSVGSFLTVSIVMSLILMQLSQNFTFLWLTFWVKSRATNATDLAFDDVHETTSLLDHGYNAMDNIVHALVNVSLAVIHNLDGHNNLAPSTKELTIDNRTLTLPGAYTNNYYLEIVSVCAKVKFFDITPTGRIVNRFSSDTYTVDDSLPFILNILLAQIFSLIGVSCVRGMGVTESWCERGEEATERWQRAALCGGAAAQWLGLRLQCVSAAALGAAAALAALQRATHVADPGLVGLAISYALSMTSMLSNVLNAFTETEREMIAVERVGEYIEQVKSEKVEGESPPYGWPTHGVISFEDVYLNYSESSTRSPALRGVSFSSHPGERVAVVGRTGAGKSSLLRAILRLTPARSGRVLIDDVDVSTSRISIIPQEPFIFTGNIRDNVDPLRQYLDIDVWRALDACGVRDAVVARGGLHAAADKLARGHRQLLCLVRAILQRAKILLIDEATANLDQETERLILDTIRSSFIGCTVLFIAHRLTGVLESSRVIVMSAGKVVEMRDPDDALSDPTSHLYQLVHPDN